MWWNSGADSDKAEAAPEHSVTARADERPGTAADLHSRRRDAEGDEGLARRSLPRTDQSPAQVQTAAGLLG